MSQQTQTPVTPQSAVQWYFIERPLAIAHTYAHYAVVFAEVFSFVFLLRTLFAPWKNIRDEYPTRGFNLSLILQTLTFNVITRMIGAIIRLGAIAFGIAAQFLLLLGFALYFAVWIFFPGLLLLGIVSLLGF